MELGNVLNDAENMKAKKVTDPDNRPRIMINNIRTNWDKYVILSLFSFIISITCN